MTRNFRPSTGTGKKLVTATQTAPNQTAGPLAQISQYVINSYRAVFKMLHLDKNNTPIISGPSPRSKDYQPTRLHLPYSVDKLILLFTRTMPSHDKQILVLTEICQIKQ
jgi:hypothetical protein